ncbi:MAG: ABC transporter ATP-binding protein [Planctomycetota bacterium]
MSRAAVEFHGVWKRFRLGAAHDSLVDLIGGGIRKVVRGWAAAGPSGGAETGATPGHDGRDTDSFWAVRELDFSLGAGDALGIVGPNGAGKSTALKLISGILEPDRGTVSYRGRLASLIEVGAGFHGDLTGRENVYLNGAILGMRRPEVRAKLDRIVAFAGLERFMDTPVKRYSSGMYARLGFSIAAHVDPDVLLVDEVLSVGDAIFRLRCEQRMRELVSQGTTLVFVTHNLEQMQSICSRAIVLESGKSSFDGRPRDAIHHYMTAQSRATAALPTDVSRDGVTHGSGDSASLTFLNGQQEDVIWARSRASLTVALEHEATESHESLAYEVACRATAGENVVCFNSARAGQTFCCRLGRNRIILSLPTLPLAAGRYFWNVRIWDTRSGDTLVNTPFKFPLIIDDEGQGTGLLCLEHGWSAVTVPSQVDVADIRAPELSRPDDYVNEESRT